MQTSLARRQRRRRNGGSRGSGGGGAASRVAIALPLFLFGTLALLAVVGLGSALAAFNYYSTGLPDPKALLDHIQLSQETVVYDRTGTIELARFGAIKRTVVQYSQIPPVMVDATTSVEDQTFWQNAGFDPIGIVSAAVDTVTGKPRGASTITQQLVRNALLPQDALGGSTYERKIREIIQSIRLTQELPPGVAGKQQIMAAYLNQNFYGNQSYGIAAAAESYFGISDLSKLDLAQAAILAGIPKSPTDYDLVQNAQETCLVTVATGSACPAGKTVLEVPQNTLIYQRRNHILELMKTNSTLTSYSASDFAAAEAEPVILTPPPAQNWLAPQFVWQVRHQLGTILCPSTPDACEKVDTGGYKVITTLDYGLQTKAEKWVKAAGIAPNQKDTAAYLKSINVPYQQWIRNLKGRGIYNAALGAIDYRTGDIVAYVGSADYYASPRGAKFQPQFDVLANGWRQPGSSFKAIGYLAGIEDHVTTAATMFMDVVTNFGGGYTPADADLDERGPVRLRQAIQLSLNIPAIKAAIIEGPDKVFNFAKQMGIVWQSSKNPGGASIAIGTVEVHFIDEIGAYGAIANGGKLLPRTTILSVTEPNGKADWPPASGLPTGPPGRQPSGRLHHAGHPGLEHRPQAEPVLVRARDLQRQGPPPGRPQDRYLDRRDRPGRDGLPGPAQGPQGRGPGCRDLDGQLGQQRSAERHGRPRDGGQPVAGLPRGRQQGHPRGRLRPAPGGRGPGLRRRQQWPAARSVHRPDGQGMVHRRHCPQPDRQHQDRGLDRLRHRAALAGRLPRPAGDQGLP